MPKINLKLLPGQILAREKILEGYKEILMTCGTGYGKTYGGARITVLEWLKPPTKEELKTKKKRKLLAISPTIGMVKRTVVAEIQETLDSWGFKKDKHYEYHKSDRVFTVIKTQAKIYCIGAEAHEAMQGIHPSFIWCDECGLYREDAWMTIEQRASFCDAILLCTSTPYFWNRYKDKVDLYYANPNDPKKRRFAFKVPSIANPDYKLHVYEERKKLWPKWKFDMMYNGEFTSPKGLIYQNFRTCIVDDFPIPNNWEKWGAIDYGSTHPTAILWFAKDPDTGITYVYDEWVESDKNVSDINFQLEKEYCPYYADTSGKQISNELCSLGHDVSNAIKDVEPGIILVNSMINDGKLKVMNRCIRLQQEAYRYSWMLDKKTDKPTNRPTKDFDDACDALRYGLVTHLENKINPMVYTGDQGLHSGINRFDGYL